MLRKSLICIGVWCIAVEVVGISITASDQHPIVERNELRYRETQSDHELDHAVFWPIHLSHGVPEDVRVDVEFRGGVQRFGQMFYGTPNSRRITVVVDEVDRERFDLYVDRSRSRRITKRDLVSGEPA